MTTAPDIDAFLGGLEPARRCAEAHRLDRLFRDVTGWSPRLWRANLIGYGAYHYRYASGREGDFLATGFSPLTTRHSIHILPGYADHDAILARLGKHRTGRSCVYVNTLADIDLDVLAELIRAGLDDLRTHWPITPS